MNTAEQFLMNLTEGAMEGFVLLWRLEGKRSEWWIPKLSHNPTIGDKERDLYVGVALSPFAYGAQQRCKADNVAGLLGLVADVDIADPLHKKPGAPKNEEEAYQIIRSLLPPTVIVHSGHGLQAWWLFREPWMFGDTDERVEAQLLARRWGATLQEHARRMGCSIDSVHDLARVMRVPGTLNAKDPENVVPCRLLEENWGCRYNPPEDFEGYLLPDSGVVATMQIVPDMGTAFPTAKHEAFLENDKTYKASWLHRRRDLADKSLSGYDMSLASLAGQAGWSPGEIAALIRAHRAKYDEFEKGCRPDYVQGVVSKAMAGMQTQQEKSDAVKVLLSPESPREDRLRLLGERLGVPFTNIRRLTGSVQIFEFVIDNRLAQMQVRDLMNQSNFRSLIYASCGRVPAKVKPRESPTWDETAMLMYALAEEVDAGDEAERDGETRGWIRAYCEANPPEELETATVEYGHLPFIWEGQVWINMYYFQDWLRMKRLMSGTPTFVRQQVKALGAKQRTFGVVSGGKRTTASFWGVSWESSILDTQDA